MIIIDAGVVSGLFRQLGAALTRPATLCLIGSTPGIANGQPDRQTPDIDVWHAGSDYDAGELEAACERLGILFDPKDEVAAGQIYVQIVRPGIVALPRGFELETIGRYGNLTVAMPPPAVIAAAKLVRGSVVDIEDVAFWVKRRRLAASDIERAIDDFPDPRDRETARENIVYVRLVMGGDWS